MIPDFYLNINEYNTFELELTNLKLLCCVLSASGDVFQSIVHIDTICWSFACYWIRSGIKEVLITVFVVRAEPQHCVVEVRCARHFYGLGGGTY